MKVRNAEGQTALFKRELDDLMRLHEETLAELEALQAVQTKTSHELQSTQHQLKELQERSAPGRSAPAVEPLPLTVQTACATSADKTANARQRSEILELKKSLAFAHENLAAKDEELAELQRRCDRLENEAMEQQEVCCACRDRAPLAP